MPDLCSRWGPKSIGRLGCAQDCSVLVSPPRKGQCMCPQRTLAQHVHSGSGSLLGELALGDHLLCAGPVPVFCLMVTQAIGCWLMSLTPQEGTERWEYLLSAGPSSQAGPQFSCSKAYLSSTPHVIPHRGPCHHLQEESLPSLDSNPLTPPTPTMVLSWPAGREVGCSVG